MKLEIELTEEELNFIQENIFDFEQHQCVILLGCFDKVDDVINSLVIKGFLHKIYDSDYSDDAYHATNLWNYVNEKS